MTLQIIINPVDELSMAVMSQSTLDPAQPVRTLDLTAPHPDYGILIEAVFQAENVHIF